MLRNWLLSGFSAFQLFHPAAELISWLLKSDVSCWYFWLNQHSWQFQSFRANLKKWSREATTASRALGTQRKSGSVASPLFVLNLWITNYLAPAEGRSTREYLFSGFFGLLLTFYSNGFTAGVSSLHKVSQGSSCNKSCLADQLRGFPKRGFDHIWSATFTQPLQVLLVGGVRFTLGWFIHRNQLRLQPLRRELMSLWQRGREQLGPSMTIKEDEHTWIQDDLLDFPWCYSNVATIRAWNPKFASMLTKAHLWFAFVNLQRFPCDPFWAWQFWLPTQTRWVFGVCCCHAGLRAYAWAVAAGGWVLVVWDQCSHRLPRPPTALCPGESKRWGRQVQGPFRFPPFLWVVCVCVKCRRVRKQSPRSMAMD